MVDTTLDLKGITADIVSAMVGNNTVRNDELPQLITSVYEALSGLGVKDEPEAPTFEAATTVKKSLADPSKIISMIDGKGYSSLKRHLASNGLTLTEYKERYNLPANYPSIAPGYSAQRREISLKLGLGKRDKAPEAAPVKAPAKAAKKTARKSPIERLRDAKASSPMSQSGPKQS
jgi:predicted transcriptional regulator